MRRKHLLFFNYLTLSCLTTLSAHHALGVNDLPAANERQKETRIPQAPGNHLASATGGQATKPRLGLGKLAQRLQIFSVPVTAEIDPGKGEDNPSSFWDGKPLRPVVFAPQIDGGAKVGWTDTVGTVHITPLDRHMRRCGADMLLNGVVLRDLVAHTDGSAILTLQEGGMYLTRIRNQETIFRKRLISNASRDIHWGSLAWNGDNYGTYFAVHGGGHEGDSLRFVNSDGEIVEGGWNWGVSHSIDMRLVSSGDAFFPVALSDAYPGTGIYFNHRAKRISYTWGDFSGGTGGRLGGLVATDDRIFLAFASKEGGRKHWSVALGDFAKEHPHAQRVHKYLEDTDCDQLNVKMARYGKKQLLISWVEAVPGDRKFCLYNFQGERAGPAEVLSVTASPRGDFQTLPDGSVAWADCGEAGSQMLKIMRITPSRLQLATFNE